MANRIDDAAKHVIKLRLPEDPKLGQYHIDRISLKNRIIKIMEYANKDSPILFVGDDDFTSLALDRLGYKNLSVLDVDEKILQKLSSLSDGEIETTRFDLREIYKGVYPNYSSKFELFVTDPPTFSFDGLQIFSIAGIKSLKLKGVGMIAVPYKWGGKRIVDPKGSTDRTKEGIETVNFEFQRFILNNGCMIEELIPKNTKTPHGTFSSTIIIKKTRERPTQLSLKGLDFFY
jgi:hypothetical protein